MACTLLHLTIAITIVVAYTVTVVSANNPPPRDCNPPQNLPKRESYQRICLQSWNVNRTYHESSAGPVARALSRTPGAAQAIREITGFFAREHQRVLALAARGRVRRFEIPKERPCNIPLPSNRNDGPLNSANVSLSQQGWGLFQSYCVTELEVEPSETPVDSMQRFVSYVNTTARSVVDQLGLRWKNPDVVNLHKYRTSTNNCRMWHYTGYRISGKWALDTGYTNDLVSKYLPEWERVYLAETLYVDGYGAIQPVRKLMRKRPDTPYKEKEPFITDFVNGTTTHTSTWGGVPAGSNFIGKHWVADSPAINAAVGVGAATIEQIEAATTVSGMALLIVPILFTTIPISLFTEVGTAPTLMYILATDVLTVLPLGIKGYELMEYTAKKYEATRTWLYGGLRNDEPAVMESWYANCDANEYISVFGILFLTMAVFFMITGIVLEFACKKYFDTKRRMAYPHAPYLKSSQCPVFCGNCERPMFVGVPFGTPCYTPTSTSLTPTTFDNPVLYSRNRSC